MTGSIVVPTDGSPEAEQALLVALPLAQALHCPLTLVWVWEGLHDLDTVLSPKLTESITAREVGDRRTFLERLIAQHCAPKGVAAEVAVPIGDAAAKIVETAEVIEARYIAMATHGRSGLKRWRLGSVADRVARTSPMPAVLYRPQPEAPFPGQFARILVPLDGSEHSQIALAEAHPIALATGATIRLLRAVNVFVPLAPIGTGLAFDQANREAEAYAQRYLADAAARYAGPPFETAVVVGSASHTILEAAETVDLIVMGTHGRGGLPRLALGSVADAVVRGSGKPVMLVRAHEPPAQG